jgi:hypothetical protein
MNAAMKSAATGGHLREQLRKPDESQAVVAGADDLLFGVRHDGENRAQHGHPR